MSLRALDEQTMSLRAVPLGQPVLRYSELNEDSTRYDYLVAAPSDNDLVKMWVSTGSVSVFVAIVVAVIFASILLSKKTRKLSFNLYLVGLMIPDLTMNFFCSIRCFMAVAARHSPGPAMCRFQSWFTFFGFTGNAWMSAIILRELHRMLRSARSCTRYQPPSKMTVVKQTASVLLYSGFIAVWGILPESWGIPIRTAAQSGYACMPIEYNHASSLFYFLVFLPAVCLIPMAYTVYVCIDIWRKSLMPRRGQRKQIAAYLLRMVLTMFIWWLPCMFFKVLAPSLTGPWVKLFFSVWVHLQAVVSATLMLGKSDIKNAVKQFVTCKVCCFSAMDERNECDKANSGFDRSRFGFGWSSSAISNLSKPTRALSATTRTGTNPNIDVPDWPSAEPCESRVREEFGEEGGGTSTDEESSAAAVPDENSNELGDFNDDFGFDIDAIDDAAAEE